MYHLCLDCYFGRKVKPKKLPAVVPIPKKHYRIEYSEAWTDGFMLSDKRFIYILEFDDRALYVGQTANIYNQFPELRAQKTSFTTGHNARLGYLEIAANENAAEWRVSELKKLVASNPSQIDAMILEFHYHMQELGFEKES